MFSHEMIEKFIQVFDPLTGKPRYYEKVKNWPMMKLTLSLKYNENLKNLIGNGVNQSNIPTLIVYRKIIWKLKLQKKVVKNMKKNLKFQ